MKKIEKLRIDHDLKQETVAKMLNITRSQYSKIETGASALSLDKAIILANFYKVSLDELLDRLDYVLITREEYLILKKAAQIILKIESKIKK